jgi:group I intron endonuclease
MKTINNSVGTRSNYPFKMPTHLGLPTLCFDQVGGKMDNQNGTIYIATNLINGKQYVGQTIRNLEERKRGHRNGRKNQVCLLTRAIKKYGEENFKWISFSCPKENLNWQETFLIKNLITSAPNGYNLESGGCKNKIVSEITRKRMSDIRIEKELSKGENNPRFGKPILEVTKNKMRKKRLEYFSKYPEEKRKISIRMKGKFLGGKHPRAKAVVLISPKGIKYKLSCYKPFCREYGLNVNSICSVLRGKQKNHKGWTGEYL